MHTLLRDVAKTVLHPLVERAGRGYVAGADLPAALRVHQALAEHGYTGTLCYWEASTSLPEETARHYMEIVRALAASGMDAHISVKAPALRFSGGLFGSVFEEARRAGLLVHFDSLGPEHADSTFALALRALEGGTATGCTLPGRWPRSAADARRLAGVAMRVRVVKGQWPDPEHPRRDPAAGFLEAIGQLAGRPAPVAVATHHPMLAREALSRLCARGTPCELELLYGLPSRRVLASVADLGIPVRFYVPYGHAWLPYALERMARNPRMAWWLLHDACGGARPGFLQTAGSGRK